MLLSAMEAFGQHKENVSFKLFSIYSDKDTKLNQYESLEVVDSKALKMLLIYFPISILVSPFVRFKFVRKLLSISPYFRELLDCDCVVDLCGIAFVDGRGFPLLVYNMACCLIPINLNVPVFKMSQALGPFNKLLNRKASKFCLDRCIKVVARGDITYRNLDVLNLKNSDCLPDVSFFKEINNDLVEKAAIRVNKTAEKLIILAPSKVVENLCESKGINFIARMSDLILSLKESGHQVVLISHSVFKGKGKNNDIDVCNRIQKELEKKGKKVGEILDVEDSLFARALIGQADLFIGCRFHSVVASLSMGVPPVVIGWSHKYVEMVKPFGVEDFVLDFSEFNSSKIFEKIEDIMVDLPEITSKVQSNVNSVKNNSRKNFQYVKEFLSLEQANV